MTPVQETQQERFKQPKRKKTIDLNPIPPRVKKQRRALKAISVNKTFAEKEASNLTHSPARILAHWDDNSLVKTWFDLQRHSLAVQLPIQIELRCASQLSAIDISNCLQIVQHTSGADYKSSSIGWSASSKIKEMSDPNLLYILIRSDDVPFAPTLPTHIVAFASFMITNDDPPREDQDVVYIYEVHIAEQLRGQGLGKWFICNIEAMGRTAGISKVMLTVFKCNTNAIKVYEKLGYSRDDASPADRKTRGRIIEADYMIMSKTDDS